MSRRINRRADATDVERIFNSVSFMDFCICNLAMTTEVVELICEKIRQNPCMIKTINIQNSTFTETQAAALLIAFGECPNIKTVYLGINNNTHGKPFQPAMAFYRALAFVVGDNKFGAEEVRITDDFEWEAFADLNRALKHNTRIHRMSFAEIPQTHKKETFDILEDVLKTNLTLQHWYCYYARPDSYKQLANISEALERNRKAYEELHPKNYDEPPSTYIYTPSSPVMTPSEDERKTVKRYSPTSPSSPSKKIRVD